MKRLLFISNLYPLPWEPNRATFNRQQVERLAEHYQIDILIPVAWPDYFRNLSAIRESNSEHVKYVCYWYTPKMLYASFGRFMSWSLRLSSARAWFRSRRYDMIYATWAYPDGYAASQISKNLGVPFVLKVHGSDINILAADQQRGEMIAQTCASAMAVVSVSEALKEKLVALGCPEHKVSCIYNGVDGEKFFPEAPSDSGDYFLYVGNLKRDKGVLDLVHAYTAYRKTGGKRPLKYVGGGAMMSELKALVQAAGLTDSVTFFGALPHEETAQHIRQCSALILPSYHEGVPNVLLEAGACGKPVLSTRVGGIPEVVIEDTTGVLCEPGDIDALAQGLAKLCDKGAWKTEEILEHAKQFSWDRNISQLRSLMALSSK